MANFKLTAAQKDEVRRLTQKANRRIKTAEKTYRQAGKDVLPREVVGQYQTKERWATPSTPMSRSVVFEDEQAYKKQMQFLRSFESPINAKPTLTEYTKQQRTKTEQAMETSLGIDVPKSVKERLRTMTAPELSEFWNRFSDNASRAGLRYSSDAAMQQTMDEMFGEDYDKVMDS